MIDLRSYRRVYLASAYTKHPNGRDYAYKWACGALANLIADGVTVYSPIAHWHTASILDPQNRFKWYSPEDWFELNRPEMDLCDCMVVLHDREETWKDSTGVEKEIRYFEEAQKPVLLWDSLLLTRPLAA